MIENQKKLLIGLGIAFTVCALLLYFSFQNFVEKMQDINDRSNYQSIPK
jgi:hypothetical protein